VTAYQELCESLQRRPSRWLVTGAAGFIGSHLAESLLRLGQSVVGLDNFATGSRRNLEDVTLRVGSEAARRFVFIEGDICDPRACAAACRDVDVVLHQAALGSVPRSMEDPLASHVANVDGFLQVLLAARAAGARRVIYASSSSVYGDDTSDVKQEDQLGRTLSPYAATKLIDEIYAGTLARTHGLESIGLRYFNVFGPRQDPQGAYAAVIPRWTQRLLSGESCVVYGDGSNSRDFCFVDNVVQANLLAAFAPASALTAGQLNIACGARTSLLELYATIRSLVARVKPEVAERPLLHEPVRAGDIAHSLASIERARELLGYRPAFDVSRGLQQTVAWYAAPGKAAVVQASEPLSRAALEAS